MAYLYILSEDKYDDIFYEKCLVKITKKSFNVIPTRTEKGSGISDVRRKLPPLLKSIRYTGEVEDTFFLVAVDNDRRPVHPDHEVRADWSKLPKKEQGDKCRFCEIEKVAKSILGENRDDWPIKGAIVVAVEMMETWQLLICNPDRYKREQDLPLFPKRHKQSAKAYYAFSPPAQLKDLVMVEQKRLNIKASSDFCLYCAEQLNVEDLKKRSPSFGLLCAQVADW